MLKFDSLKPLEATLTFARARQKLLANNLANVDTPGFRPSDLEDVDPLESADFVKLIEKVEDDRAPGLDGNTVSLEQQMAKLSQTRLRFGAASTITSRRLALLRYAAGNGS